MSLWCCREVVEVYNGQLPNVSVQTDCRCPSSRPRLKPGSELYCLANEGVGSPANEEYRLSTNAFVPDFMVDGQTDTMWISPLGQSEVAFTVDMADLYEVGLSNLRQFFICR